MKLCLYQFFFALNLLYIFKLSFPLFIILNFIQFFLFYLMLTESTNISFGTSWWTRFERTKSANILFCYTFTGKWIHLIRCHVQVDSGKSSIDLLFIDFISFLSITKKNVEKSVNDTNGRIRSWNRIVRNGFGNSVWRPTYATFTAFEQILPTSRTTDLCKRKRFETLD